MAISDSLPKPIFDRIIDTISLDATALQVTFNSSATFYRTPLNSNITLDIPLGTLTSGVYVSPVYYLPAFSFNSIKNTSQAIFINDLDAKILQPLSLQHNLIIQYKLTKADNYNYSNQRELRVKLVNSSGVAYDATIFSNTMPDTGTHDVLIINQYIDHIPDDIVKIAFVISQDSVSDFTNTLLTIFRISWNISD